MKRDKSDTDGKKEMNKATVVIFNLIIFVLFVVLSFSFINPYSKSIRIQKRSSFLHLITRREGNKEIKDYVDENGTITLASDIGYASMITTKNENSLLEEYYDEQGERIVMREGYYGILKQYDNSGNNTRTIYLGVDGKPVVTSQNYAIEDKTFTDEGKTKAVRYLDTKGKPICSMYYGYEKINEFDPFGNIVRTTYKDMYGVPMLAGIGYASVLRTFYPEDDPNKGRSKDEFYFDSNGNPIQQSLGNYGVHRGYDETGNNTVLTYLDAEGNPFITNKGYTTVLRGYFADCTTEMYYDINGSPYCLPEGYYGIKRQDGRTIYLNADGNEKFDLKNYLNNHSETIIYLAFFIMAISVFGGKELNIILLFFYIGAIVFFTLLYRGIVILTSKYNIFESFTKQFSDSEIRAGMIKNIWLFIPLGLIFYKLHSKAEILLAPIILSVTIEAIQYFTKRGFCELNDVINNSLGGIIGFECGRLLDVYKSMRNKPNRF